MPPPSAVDSWLAHRRFGIVIDAGSSGSRLLIYSWRDARAVQLEGGDFANSLPKVEKGAKNGDDWLSKVEPGISSFAENPDGIGPYLAPLLAHARTQIPPSLESETPLFLLATAGMRLLEPEQQARVLKATCQFLKFHSHFRIDDPSVAGPCGSSVRIITGEEEGLFGWIAVNYLMDGFTGSDDVRTTYGFLDMGGASTQIAFEPSAEERAKTKDLVEVRLRLLSGEEIHHQVFVTTWLGYGTNQARERYVAQAISEFETERTKDASHTAPTEDEAIPDPCLPKNLTLTETPVYVGSSEGHSRKPHQLVGTGSFDQCMRKTATLLNKDAPCPDSPCLFNGVHVPPIDFSVSHFIGVSEYWYSSDDAFGLGGPYDFVQYERAALDFCARDWTRIIDEHKSSQQQHDKSVDVHWAKPGNKATPSRLQMQCFKAAWIANVLHEGIGMPRLVDPGGDVKSTDGDKVAAEAEHKGLGPGKLPTRPVFQSVDSVGDVAISWTLGKMVLEASKEVPPLFSTAKPIVDPLDDIPASANSSHKPIRPPFLDFDAMEDRISHRLPTSLTRHSLGFSPVGFLFYLLIVCACLFMLARLRNYFKAVSRRTRRALKRDRLTHDRDRDHDYSIEDGWVSSPSSPTPDRWMSAIQAHPHSAPSVLPRSASRNAGTPPQYSPMLRPNSPATLSNPIALDSTVSVPSSPSYSTAYFNGAAGGLPPAAQAVYPSAASHLPRSRNASQLSLATRGQAISRTSSMTHLDPGDTEHDY